MARNLVERLRAQQEHVHPVVFPVAALLIIAFVIFGAAFADTAEAVLQATLSWVTRNFGWFMILSVALFLVFSLWLAIGPHGRVRLGPDDSRPDYNYPTWFAMLFSAGMGIGLVFWGVAEPLNHFSDAPRQAAETSAAAEDAMVFTFHHWGFGPWAVYAVLGGSLAYFGFRHSLPLTVRSALYPLIGDRMNGWPGNLVDIFAILGTMFGVATSLGLGALQVNAGLGEEFGTPVGAPVQVLLIAAITAMATVSVFTGLNNGIRRLSQLNLTVAALLLLFVAIVGPTVLLARAYVENLGAYAANFFDVLSWTGAYAGQDWLGEWTIFYWAWWISWSPFVGMFIARISRGRTMREFILGVLLVPTLVSFLWFTVFGNSALELELSGSADLLGPMEQGPEFALFAFLDALPISLIASIVAMFVVVVFFVTSSDSASFVIDMISAGGNPDPPKPQRLFWAISEGVVAAVLLIAGGLDALQAGAISTGLPFTVVLLVVVVGLFKGLRSEGRGVHIDDIPEQPLMPQEDAQDGADGAARDGDEVAQPQREPEKTP